MDRLLTWESNFICRSRYIELFGIFLDYVSKLLGLDKLMNCDSNMKFGILIFSEKRNLNLDEDLIPDYLQN